MTNEIRLLNLNNQSRYPTLKYHSYFLPVTWGLIKILIKMRPLAIAGAIFIFVFEVTVVKGNYLHSILRILPFFNYEPDYKP